MATAWTHRPLWIALSSVGIAGMAALAPSAESLSTGGLVIALAAAIAAVVLGLGITRVEEDTRAAEPSRTTTAVNSLGEVWLTVAVAAAAAPLVAGLGWFGIMLAALAWSTVAVASGSLRALAGIGALVAVAIAGVGTILSVNQGIAWTLLQPPQRLALDSVQQWLGLSVVIGVLLAGAGFGHWSLATAGHRRTPVAVIGVGLLVLVGMFLRRAAAYDQGVASGLDAVGTVLALALVVVAVLTVGWRPSGSYPLRGVIGLSATLLFAGPALPALPLWWTVLLPLGMAVCIGLRAVHATGILRVRIAVLATILVVVAWLGWPGLPTPLAAAAVALLPVIALWVTGTRVLRVEAA